MSTEKIYFKHTGLPIADMFCDISISHAKKIVEFKLDHFDSALVINAARHVENTHQPIRLIDCESANTWGAAIIKHLYALRLIFDERPYHARILKLCLSDEMTVALSRPNFDYYR